MKGKHIKNEGGKGRQGRKVNKSVWRKKGRKEVHDGREKGWKEGRNEGSKDGR